MPFICIKLSVKAKHPHLNYRCGRPSVLLPNLPTIVILRTDPQGFLRFSAQFCRDCHIKNQSARTFLGFGASFLPPHARLFAIFRGARKPTKRYIRLLDCFTTSNHQSLLFLFHFVLSISHSFVSSIILSVFAFLIN